jgi:hypothetical protein
VPMRIGKAYQNFPQKFDKFLAWQAILNFHCLLLSRSSHLSDLISD